MQVGKITNGKPYMAIIMKRFWNGIDANYFLVKNTTTFQLRNGESNMIDTRFFLRTSRQHAA
jgi:hypothetical protein